MDYVTTPSEQPHIPQQGTVILRQERGRGGLHADVTVRFLIFCTFLAAFQKYYLGKTWTDYCIFAAGVKLPIAYYFLIALSNHVVKIIGARKIYICVGCVLVFVRWPFDRWFSWYEKYWVKYINVQQLYCGLVNNSSLCSWWRSLQYFMLYLW